MIEHTTIGFGVEGVRRFKPQNPRTTSLVWSNTYRFDTLPEPSCRCSTRNACAYPLSLFSPGRCNGMNSYISTM